MKPKARNQGICDIQRIHLYIVSTERYLLYTQGVGMLQHINRKFTLVKLNSILVTIHQICQFLDLSQSIKQTKLCL